MLWLVILATTSRTRPTSLRENLMSIFIVLVKRPGSAAARPGVRRNRVSCFPSHTFFLQQASALQSQKLPQG